MKYRIFYILLISVFIVIAPAEAEVLRVSRINIHNGLESNNVRSIVQDSKGFIWFGTTDGLFRYNGYQVNQVMMNDKEHDLYKDKRIHELAVWDGRYILVRLRGRLFSMYDTDMERFVDFTGNNTHSEQYKDFVITSGNDFWLVDKDNGAKHVWRKNGSFFSKKMKTVPDNISKALAKRHQEKDSAKQKWMQWIEEKKTTQTELQSLSPYIYDIFCDNSNNIFIGEEDRGVTVINKLQNMTEYLYNGSTLMDRSNIIRVVWEQEDGSILMYNNRADISAIRRDRAGHLWIGTRKHGILVDGKAYDIDVEIDESQDNKITDFCEDRQGRMWISMFSGPVIVAMPDGRGGYSLKVTKLNVPNPRKMLCDGHGRIWIAGAEGVCIIDPKTMARKDMVVGTDNAKLNEIHTLYEDTRHQVWVGTIGYGLACYDNSSPGNPVLKKIYTNTDGLSDNRIESVIADRKGRLWVGTAFGLNVFSPESGLWARYFLGPTELSMMFYENSAIQLKNGRLAFGTKHGVAVIDPEQITAKTAGGPGYHLIVTDIQVNGTPVGRMAKDAPYQGATWLQKCVELNYEQNTLNFYVSNFDYFSGLNTSYQFFLEGYDKDWGSPQKENHKEYTALEPGEYTLHVKAASVNGETETGEFSMKIIIRPPLWATWWAYLIYAIVIFAGIVVSWRIYRRHEELQQQIRIEEQLTKYKMMFFTNVSHEFRIPLTIIRGCMEEIWGNERMPAEIKQPVINMYKNTKRMLRLINQLMDFSRIHEQKLKLRVEETEIVAFVRDIVDTFRDTAEQRNMSLEFHTTDKKTSILVDQDFIDKILYNLIGNAFKYSHSKGTVKVSVETNANDNVLHIRVADNGIGISKEKQQQLFSRFDQSAVINDSIGIGLHMSKVMAETHHALLSFAENIPSGSIFTLTLSMLSSTYKQQERMSPDTYIKGDEADASATVIPQNYSEMDAPPFNDKVVLVVEDDIDVQQYIKKTLATHFRVITAANGEDALQMFSDDVALVITDCLMPAMNGTQLVRNIRNGNVNPQVPVIMLTALTSEMEQIKAFKVGVNLFVQKPFSPKVLLAQTISILQADIKKENTIKQNISSDNVVTEKKPTLVIDAQDMRFRKLFDKWIEEHIADTDLGVDKMAEGLKIGRTVLFKRVKGITGKTPNDYIRTKRMEYAQSLLADDSLTIQQVAIKVGIEDAYYFSKVFKSVTGMSPSQYRKTGGNVKSNIKATDEE